jgi:hypothetical protein
MMQRFVIRFASGARRVVRARDELHARAQGEVIACVLATSCTATQAIVGACS